MCDLCKATADNLALRQELALTRRELEHQKRKVEVLICHNTEEDACPSLVMHSKCPKPASVQGRKECWDTWATAEANKPITKEPENA